MLNTKSFLAVDFGAGSLKLAEFEVNEAGGLRLKEYAIEALGAEGAQESTREATMLKALQKLLTEKGIKSKDVNVCAPGFHVFSKFVKLPPVDAGKVTQIIQYEAQQNVPFPLEEVVWDYQILGSTPGGELEVLLVAIKADIVEGLFRVSESAGLHLQLADVSPAALCNAFRYNYGDLEDCTMLLDIGAKTSNLLFFEKGKVYSRSINIGANAITQDFSNESKLAFDKAEKIKISEGFVSLGGAYAEPENAYQAAISKIARQFMTRLHIQVNQTMQFYRGQQGGSAPQRLFLSGGASIMPYTAQFFAEKLNVPVEYFNPLRNVAIDPAINLEDLARVAHQFGEVVGLGLRNLAHCPVELNLMPESTLKWQAFNQKKPYFMATVFSLVLVVAGVGLLYDKLAADKAKQLEKLNNDIRPLQARADKFKAAFKSKEKANEEVNHVAGWLENRFYWADVLTELRRVLIKVEAETKTKLNADTGVWIEKLEMAMPSGAPGAFPGGLPGVNPQSPGEGAPVVAPGQISEEQRRYLERYGPRTAPPRSEDNPAPQPQLPQGEPAPTPPPGGEQNPGTPATPGAIVGGEGSFTMICRAVDQTAVKPEAKTDLIFALERELAASTNFFQKVELSPNMTDDPASGTFAFGVGLQLKKPIKL